MIGMADLGTKNGGSRSNSVGMGKPMFRRQDTTGYAGGEWDARNANTNAISTCGIVVMIFSITCVVLTFPLSLIVCMKVVAEYERAVIFRLGRISRKGAKGPGLFFVLPCVDTINRIDLRTVTFDVPPQEVLTKDSVTVAVDAVVYYRIFKPVVSVTNVEDSDRSTRLLAQTTLRNVLGTKSLSEILIQREEISALMQEGLDLATDPWGVKVERVEIKDVRLPVQLQRAMAAEAEAAREARAKVIAAEGEKNASRALKEAADVLHESHFALQLRYLQTLCAISAEKNSTIIFPLPIEMLKQLGANANGSSNAGQSVQEEGKSSAGQGESYHASDHSELEEFERHGSCKNLLPSSTHIETDTFIM